MKPKRVRLQEHTGWLWVPFMCALPALAWLSVFAGGTATALGKTKAETGGRPRVFLIDAESLARTRSRVAAGVSELAAPMAKLRQEADEALKTGPFSVMDKKFVPPSGDKHDYMSLGPYWWPDPNKSDGLPYIRRDGEVNPETRAYDRKPLGQMTSAVETLTLAYFLTAHEPYAKHAARLLRVWFLDEATRMNPHLEYGQAIPGRTEGRGIGIIDTAQLSRRLVDAVGMLAASPAWTRADQEGLEAWFRQYLAWLRESTHGRDEDRTKNNHATWYDVQVATFALFAGEDEIARDVLRKVPDRRIATQIEADGRQPLELARTRSWDYSTMNLRGMFALATLGEHVGMDLWNVEPDDGRSIRQALEWLIPYAMGEKDWAHRQIHKLQPTKLVPLLRRAAIAYQEPRYERLARRIGHDPTDLTRHLLPVPEYAVTLVENNQARAVVVTADTPLPVAKHAADELVHHVREATGVTLPVAAESAVPENYGSRLFLGKTRAAREQGIVAEELRPEEFVMRSVGRDLYIVGDEDEGDPLSQHNSKCGTLFGVYELLERCLGVRWLWPGKLGTYIPPADTVRVKAVDESTAPRLAYREIAWGRVHAAAIKQSHSLSETEKMLGFSPEGLVRYGHDLQDYLRRHRMGGMDRKPGTGHHFSGWWDRYGEQHPEWFMMHEDGTRGPSDASGTRNVPMCVSNPDLQRFIVERWNGESAIRLGEVDWPDVCRCPTCRAWDGPQPDPLPEFLVSQTDSGSPRSSSLQRHRGHVLRGFHDPMCTSDRYARFWQAVRRMAAERDGDALVTTYLYYTYFPAPVADIELGEHVFGEFVPWGNPQHTDFFPMREEALEWLKEQWLGWQPTGMRMSYRPNYLHDGWVMPLVNVRQAAEFFQFAVEHGMEGSRFDSLTGQWAAHGPKLYVHMRLHAKPELAVDDILDEYYEAFGPAASAVREYFEYWEEYCTNNLQRINDLYIDVGHRWSRFQLRAHEAFPPSSFEPAEAILERARRAAAEHPRAEYAARVAFLAAGLEHARLAGRLAACFDAERTIPEDSERFEQAIEALRELTAFRRAHEAPYISDFFYGAAWREGRYWNLSPLFARLETDEAPAAGTADHESSITP